MTRSIYSLWPWNGCAATAAPDAPYDLSSSGVTSSSITLNWEDATSSPNDASSYEVGISSNGGTTWTTVTVSAPASLHTFSGLASGTTHDFRVRGVNCFGTGNYDGEAFTQATAAGSIAPSWSLDFSSGSFSGATLTRASSGTYVDSSGYIASAATDVARLTHNSSGSRLGLLVEESRTNTFTFSEDPANAIYAKTNSSIDNNGGSFWTSPANTSDAVLLKQNTSTGTHTLTRALGTSTDSCCSVFLKKQSTSGVGRYATLLLRRASTSYYHATFDLDQGTVTQTAMVGSLISSADYGIENYGNGWYRCWIRGTMASANPSFYVCLATTGTPTMTDVGESYTGANSTDGVYIWGFMREANNTPPTSYIETPSNATVTRSADLAHVLDSNITSWGDPGALVVHFYPPGQAGTLLSTDDASGEQVGIEASSTTAARAFWSSGSTSTGTIGSSGVQKAVHYWNGSTSKFCINGGTVQSGTNNFTIANSDYVTLGAEAVESGGVPDPPPPDWQNYANCIIRKVEFYSGTLTDANLQTITT